MTPVHDPRGRALPKRYWRLLVGYLTSAFGDGVYLIAISWWVVTSTGSPADMGVVSAAGAVTFVVLAPFAGRLIDRLGAVRLLIAADVWRALVLGGFLVLGDLGADRAGLSFFVPLMALMAVGTSVSQPGLFALIPALVPAEDVRRANSTLVTGRSVAAAAGPAVSGVLVGFAGVGSALIVNIVTFLVSAAVLSAIRSDVPEAARRGASRGPRAHSAAWVILRSRSTVSAFMVALLGNLVLSMYVVTLPLKFALPPGAEESAASVPYGLTQAAFQVGMIVLGLLLSRRAASRIPTTSRNVAVGLICLGGAMTGVGHLDTVPAVLLLASLAGGSLMFVSVLSDPQLQLKVPETHRGSVQGAVQGLGSGLRPVGILAATSLFAVGGSGLALLAAAAVAVAVSLMILVLDGYRDAVNPEPALVTSPPTAARRSQGRDPGGPPPGEPPRYG